MLDYTDQNLAEARRYLPNGSDEELRLFAERQKRARLRLTRLKAFYDENYCRMTRLHLLAAAAIALGRFCGVSKVFDEIGESLMPIDAHDKPRGDDWVNYVAACRKNMPPEICEELWLTAHFKDIETVQQNDLEIKFTAEAERHRNEPLWQYLQQHLEVTLGVRMMDQSAVAGLIAHETAMTESIFQTVFKLSTACRRLVGLYAKESARAVFDFSGKPGENILTYRQTAFELTRYFLLSFGVSKILRQGVRNRERGRVATEENWNLLELTLGEKVDQINPLIREFYANPSRFDVTATLKLETLPARFWAHSLTLLLGQGLYEHDLHEIPARFRIFQRRDGSMHFVRELYCDGVYRVFDADFVVRENTLYEVFNDLKVAIEMNVEPLNGDGLSIKNRRVLFHGIAMPNIGLTVDFQSRVEKDFQGKEVLKVDGILTMNPQTKIGAFFAYKILRRPKILGSIHYTSRKRI